MEETPKRTGQILDELNEISDFHANLVRKDAKLVEARIPRRTTSFRDDLLADLADPNEAATYLKAALEDSEEMFLVALRDVAEAKQMAKPDTLPVAENRAQVATGAAAFLPAVVLN